MKKIIEKQSKLYQRRNFLVDRLRGIALSVMLLHHIGYDLYYLFDRDWLYFTQFGWFEDYLRPAIVALFIFLAGISTNYSQRTLHQARRIALAAIAITAVAALFSYFSATDNYIYFQVLHMLAICFYLTHLLKLKQRRGFLILLMLVSFILNSSIISGLGLDRAPVYLLPLGLGTANAPAMSDYLPLLPWSGWFWLGILVGKLPIWQKRGVEVAFYSPLALMGRHSLAIYLLHQPLILFVLYLLEYMSII